MRSKSFVKKVLLLIIITHYYYLLFIKEKKGGTFSDFNDLKSKKRLMHYLVVKIINNETD